MAKGMTNSIGVLGGMGPLATQLFYRMVIERTDARCDQEHVNMIILNHATMPDRTDAILSGRTQELYEELLADCKFLESAGSTHIAVPCNTSHFLLDKLQSEIRIPILNMIREAASEVFIQRGKGARVGILATDGTVKLGLYQDALHKVGLLPVLPSFENQRRIMKIIYDGVKNGGMIDFNAFEEVEKELLLLGCDCAIMGCTELSCFKEMYGVGEFYIDAMESLAKGTIIAAGKKIKP